MTSTTSVRLTDEQRAKLRQMAAALGTNRNDIMQRLIDNAEIRPVTRREAVAVLEEAGEETPPRKAKRPLRAGAGRAVLD